MRLRVFFLTVNLFFAMLLAACANAAPNSQLVPVTVPNVPQPTAGKSVVAGQFKKNTDQQPLANVPVYLAQVYKDANNPKGVFALDMARAPSTLTDEQGFFVLNDIVPNEYVLVVGRSDSDNDIVRESNGDARVYKAESDKVLNVGALTVKAIRPPGT